MLKMACLTGYRVKFQEVRYEKKYWACILLIYIKQDFLLLWNTPEGCSTSHFTFSWLRIRFRKPNPPDVLLLIIDTVFDLFSVLCGWLTLPRFFASFPFVPFSSVYLFSTTVWASRRSHHSKRYSCNISDQTVNVSLCKISSTIPKDKKGMG